MPVPFLFYRRHIGDFRRHKTKTIMLYDEVKQKLLLFLETTPLDFVNAQEMKANLQNYFEDQLCGCSFSQEKYDKEGGGYFRISTLKRSGETVLIELVYKCEFHSKADSARMYEFWEKVEKLERMPYHSLVLFLTDRKAFLSDKQGQYAAFATTNGRHVSNKLLTFPNGASKGRHDLSIQGTYILQWNCLKKSDRTFFYLMTEVNSQMSNTKNLK